MCCVSSSLMRANFSKFYKTNYCGAASSPARSHPPCRGWWRAGRWWGPPGRGWWSASWSSASCPGTSTPVSWLPSRHRNLQRDMTAWPCYSTPARPPPMVQQCCLQRPTIQEQITSQKPLDGLHATDRYVMVFVRRVSLSTRHSSRHHKKELLSPVTPNIFRGLFALWFPNIWGAVLSSIVMCMTKQYTSVSSPLIIHSATRTQCISGFAEWQTQAISCLKFNILFENISHEWKVRFLFSFSWSEVEYIKVSFT